MNTNTTTTTKTAVADRLARISVQSTLNLFISKECNETLFELKNDFQKDLAYFDNMPTIAQTITDLENRHAENLVEIATDTQAIKDIKKALEITTNGEKVQNLCEYMGTLTADINRRRLDNKIINAELPTLYAKLDYTYSNAFDLYQTAFESILEKIDLVNLDETADLEKTLENLKTVIVAEIPYKTKNGFKTYTLKQWADKAVRNAINEKRTRNATKTLYIITNETDENGNEILLKADALATAGGISDIYEKTAFTDTLAKLNLTETELLIIRLLMQGKTTRQIADRIGVKAHTTIVRKIEKIRQKALEIGLKP